jgi:hypothetical protein
MIIIIIIRRRRRRRRTATPTRTAICSDHCSHSMATLFRHCSRSLSCLQGGEFLDQLSGNFPRDALFHDILITMTMIIITLVIMLHLILVYPSSLKTEAPYSRETSVKFHQTTCPYVIEVITLTLLDQVYVSNAVMEKLNLLQFLDVTWSV